jgi:DNA-binding XRE family transcriptional regulator
MALIVFLRGVNVGGHKTFRPSILAGELSHYDVVQVQPTGGPKWAFGKVLGEYGERKKISQEQLAEAAGLDRSFISLVERGIQSPNIVVLIKIAEVREVPAADLIARMESIIKLQ